MLGWKDCLSKADFTPTAIRYATTDDDLYEQYIEKTTVRCVSSVGVAAKFQAFASGCRVEGAVDFHSTNDANGDMPSGCYESKTGDICLYEWLEGRYPRREDLVEAPD